PHTLAHTNLRDKQIGDPVNLEADVIGKYVERLLAWRSEQPQQERRTGLTPEFLREHGFL
ncbi:MAG: riboflavin synthase, partial [Brevibacillus sp.]